jgi:hypothetical protein
MNGCADRATLARIMAREDFIAFSRREFRIYACFEGRKESVTKLRAD